MAVSTTVIAQRLPSWRSGWTCYPGFRQRRFRDLPDRDKRDILKLMARIAEQAYRRGVQQGAGLAGKPSFGSTPSAASHCEISASPGPTAMPTGGGRVGTLARGVLSGPGTHPSSDV